MLSYRHAFHAGSHADVLKHVVLVQLLDHLLQKDKPLWYIDSHAGAGSYRLEEERTGGGAEFRDGIARLWDANDLPPALERYRAVVRAFNGGEGLRRYPGSPLIAAQLLRESDRLWLHELHPADRALLERAVQGMHRRVRVLAEDGFAGLRALLPPAPRRALTLIDPSYELKDDYRRVVETLRECLARFPTGVYLVWYPLLARAEARRLPAQLEGLGAPKWLHASLRVHASRGPESGLFGSGVFVVNPPFTLRESLGDSGAALRTRLGRDENADFRLACA